MPYEQEPAITRHLGEFLERHQADVARVRAEADGEYRRAVIEADADYEKMAKEAQAIIAEGTANT